MGLHWWSKGGQRFMLILFPPGSARFLSSSKGVVVSESHRVAVLRTTRVSGVVSSLQYCTSSDTAGWLYWNYQVALCIVSWPNLGCSRFACRSTWHEGTQCLNATKWIPYTLKFSRWINFRVFRELVCICENKNRKKFRTLVWEQGTLRSRENFAEPGFSRFREIKSPRKFQRIRYITNLCVRSDLLCHSAISQVALAILYSPLELLHCDILAGLYLIYSASITIATT